MSPYRPTGSRRWWVTLTTRDRRYVRLGTQTRDKETAALMQNMLHQFSGQGKRYWDLVGFLDRNRRELPRVFDHWSGGTLDQLREELSDIDLAPGLIAWEKEIRATLAAETVRKYVQQVSFIFPIDETADPPSWKPAMRTPILAPGYFKKKLEEVKGSSTNKSRYFAAWSSALKYLFSRGDLSRNPLTDYTQPASNKQNDDELYIEAQSDVVKYIEAMPEGAHRAIAALREGGGLELQSVLPMRRRDVTDVVNRIVYAKGMKNRFRSRQAIIDEFAWKYFWEFIEAGLFLPEAKLFEVREREHRDAHNEAIAKLRKDNVPIPAKYEPHKCRRTYAVRHLEAGDDPKMIADNLGHVDERMVLSLYGRRRRKIVAIVRASQTAKGGRA